MVAIQLINEPFPWTSDQLAVLRRYYEAGYQVVRSADDTQGDGIVVVLSEAFRGLSDWENFMPGDRYKGVALDVVSWTFAERATVEYL